MLEVDSALGWSPAAEDPPPQQTDAYLAEGIPMRSSGKVPKCRSAREVSAAFEALDFDAVWSHFKKEQVSSGEEEDFVDAEPFLVCQVDSIPVFNKYADREKLRIALRFLEFKDHHVFIVEWPSTAHESAVRNFEAKFCRACGDDDAFAHRGSFTAHRVGSPDKEADATFGPRNRTLNRTAPPAGRAIDDWVTLAVEVAVSQSWESLMRAAQWWASYSGVRYVLCIKLRSQASWHYRLYEIDQAGFLPDVPQVNALFPCDAIQAGVHVLTLDARKILSVPNNLALPPRVNDPIFIDLGAVAMAARED